MPSIHVRVHPHKAESIKEQRREEHHATHREHRGEALSKNRVEGHHDTSHNGTHPHHTSHHSGNHVSNPNVVHHHAVHHAEYGSHQMEHDRKTSSIKKSAPKTLQHPHASPGKPGTKPVVPPKPAGTPKPSGHPIPATPAPKAGVIPSKKGSPPQSGSFLTPNPAGNTHTGSQGSDFINKFKQSVAADQAYRAQEAYNRSHNIITGGSVYTPTVSDYSKGWTQRSSTSGGGVGEWWSGLVSNVKNWIFPGNPYY